MNPTQKIITTALQNGTLQYGASQYIAAIENAKKSLKDNEFLIVSSGGVAIYGENTKRITLVQSEVSLDIFPTIDQSLYGYSIELYLPPNTEILGSGEQIIMQNLIHIDLANVKIIDTAALATYSGKRINFPQTLVEIGDYGLADCQQLEGELYLNEGLRKIGMLAFVGCNVPIHIPSTVTEISEDAFLDVPHIYYNGSATGAPWGAQAMN